MYSIADGPKWLWLTDWLIFFRVHTTSHQLVAASVVFGNITCLVQEASVHSAEPLKPKFCFGEVGDECWRCISIPETVTQATGCRTWWRCLWVCSFTLPGHQESRVSQCQEILPADWAETVSCERSLGLRGISKRVRARNLEIEWGEARATGTFWRILEG